MKTNRLIRAGYILNEAFDFIALVSSFSLK